MNLLDAKMPGAVYKSSGKFNPALSMVGLIVALVIAALTGFLYGVISGINPLIYINFLVLGGAVMGVILAGTAAKSISKSRNTAIDMVIVFLAGYMAWHSSWAYFYADVKHIALEKSMLRFGGVAEFALQYASKHSMAVGRMGRSGLEIPQAIMIVFYFIEFVVFFVPVFVMKFIAGHRYYCETCNTRNSNNVHYDRKPAVFSKEMEMARKGDLSFIHQLNLVPTTSMIKPKPDLTTGGVEVLEVFTSNCKKCKDNAIVDIYSHTLKLDKDGKEELKDKKVLVRSVYYDVKSVERRQAMADRQ